MERMLDDREQRIRELMKRARERRLRIVPPWLHKGGRAISFDCLDERDQRRIVTGWVLRDAIPTSLRTTCPTTRPGCPARANHHDTKEPSVCRG